MENKDNVRYMSNSESNKVTREAIDIAMLDLLEKQDFDKITNMSIVKRAGVSRQSFYRNYTSKEDIIIEIIVEDWMGKRTNALHYYIVGSLSALKSVAIDWFEHGMQESPEEMSDICMKFDIANFLQ